MANTPSIEETISELAAMPVREHKMDTTQYGIPGFAEVRRLGDFDLIVLAVAAHDMATSTPLTLQQARRLARYLLELSEGEPA